MTEPKKTKPSGPAFVLAVSIVATVVMLLSSWLARGFAAVAGEAFAAPMTAGIMSTVSMWIAFAFYLGAVVGKIERIEAKVDALNKRIEDEITRARGE